ncbi:PAS domain-containing protein [Oceanospirillum sediminis]|uniref:PAS domain-containing protein n=1 Tax=Oceanospirillum sediminis TaxID=2760088 RepID=A0A839IUB0_9GAMM|nr:PAS domain-containing protein [Oceanospirillum sediminis]MBB1488262.1 PAS domain-containing protein [Oceanospirillum sediminis]
MNRQAQDSLNPSELSRKRTFQWLADAIPALACYVDASLRYRFMNTRYRKLFHLSETQDIQHLYMPGLMGEEAFAKARVYVNKVLSGEHVTYEIHLSESGEANRVLQVHYVVSPEKPLIDGF